MDNQAKITSKIEDIVSTSRHLAHHHQNDVLALLEILRALEGLHREIRESYFQDALPTNRHGLYGLLLEIEENGGWPYIDRLKIQSLLARMQQEDS